MPPELLAQFPIAEAAVEALGIVLWPMVEFEADDAIAAAAVRFGADARVERILVCTPDKDMAQLVRDERIVLWDRRRDLTYDDAGRPRQVGRAADLDPGLPGARRRRVGRLSPGCPGWGAKSAAAVLTRYGHFEDVPPQGVGLGGARASAARARSALAATLRDHWDDALLYRDLARLRTADDGVPIRQRDPEELRWDGAPRAEWEAFCEEWGLAASGDPAASLAGGAPSGPARGGSRGARPAPRRCPSCGSSRPGRTTGRRRSR